MLVFRECKSNVDALERLSKITAIYGEGKLDKVGSHQKSEVHSEQQLVKKEHCPDRSRQISKNPDLRTYYSDLPIVSMYGIFSYICHIN